MPEDSKHVQSFHCLARSRNIVLFPRYSGLGTDLVLRAGHGLLSGQCRDGVSHHLGAGGSAGEGRGVGARLTEIQTSLVTTQQQHLAAL